MPIFNTAQLGRELIARGLVPPECRLLEVSISGRPGPVILRYKVFVRHEQIPLLAAALLAAANHPATADE